MLVPKYCGRVLAVDFYCQMLLKQIPLWQYLQKELLLKYLCFFFIANYVVLPFRLHHVLYVSVVGFMY
jgi:hypothetical protein